MCRAVMVLSCVLASGAFAQELRFSGSAKSEVGVFVYGDDAGDFSVAKETVGGELDVNFINCSAYVSGNVYFDALAATADNSFSLKDGLGGELVEAWFDWTSPEFGKGLAVSFKIGRQITAWGKADGIRIADVLCPQNLTKLNAANYSESRLGIDALKLSLSGMYFSADAYWIPFFRPSALPLELWNPLRKVVVPQNVGTLAVHLGDIEKPAIKIANAAYAARLSFWFSALDFSLYGYYGFDDSPIINYRFTSGAIPPTGIDVSGNYYRYGMVGFDAAVPVKAFVLRAEAAFFIQRAVQRSAESIIAGGETYARRQQLKTLMGFDWISGDWTITAQYYNDSVFGSLANIERDAYEHGATLNVARNLFSNTLTLSLTGAIRLNDFDSYASIAAEYDISDAISLTLAADGFFRGKNDGYYGRYKELSCLRIEAEFKF